MKVTENVCGELQKEIAALQEANAELEHVVADWQADYDGAMQRIGALEDTIDELRRDGDDMGDEVTDLRRELTEKANEVEDLRRQLAEYEAAEVVDRREYV